MPQHHCEVIFTCMLRDSIPRFVSPSVGWLVGPSVGRSPFSLILSFCGLWPHCSSNSITAPAQPHATRAALYPAMLFYATQFCINTHNIFVTKLLNQLVRTGERGKDQYLLSL